MRLNLTQHQASPEQGCFEPKDKAAVGRLLTFDALPTAGEIDARAIALADLARREIGECEYPEAMIGGAPYLMGPLENALWNAGVRPVYAFSVRESVDQKQADGSVKKVAVFKHIGFVQPSQEAK